MNKKTLIAALAVTTLALGAYARPHHGGFRHARPAPIHRVHHAPIHHHHGTWGRGGCHFWPGFVSGVVGGVIGGVITDTVVAPTTVITPTTVVTPATVVTAPATTIVTTPAPVTTVQNVWVEGRYVDQVQANGTVIRVWQPGHYEQQTVTVQ